MAEVAEVCQLVDDDRLERLRRCEDEPPREGQAAVARRAAPPRPGVAQRDRRGLDTEARRVTRQIVLDRGPRARPQPLLEDRADRAAVAARNSDDELVAALRADPDDARATHAIRGIEDPQPMEIAAEPDRRPVRDAAARRHLGELPRLRVEMPPQPLVALAEECFDNPFGSRPASSRRGWEADDDAALRVDRDAETTRARRAAHDVVEAAARELDGRGGFGRDHVRRSSLPGSTPVSRPAITAGRPLTTTSSMPRGCCEGSTYVATSATVAGSKTTRSANAPSRTTPRSSSPTRAAGTDVSFAIAFSSVTRPRSRTYSPRMRAVAPYVRGCGTPASRIGCPGRRPSASVHTATHGTPRMVSTSASSMQSTTIDVSSRSSTRTSKATSGASPPRASAIAAMLRPAQSGCAAENAIRIASQPGSRVTFSQPDTPLAISVLIRSRTTSSRSATTVSSTPSARSCGGSTIWSVVAAAVYGYWSAPTSTPVAAADSRRSIAAAARPHTARAPILRWETCKRAPSPAARVVAIASSRASNTPAASFRMCVAYRAPRRAATPTSRTSSAGSAWIPGA